MGALIEVRNSWARDWEEEDAAATMVWLTSVTDRLEGFVRRSLANAREWWLANNYIQEVGVGVEKG